MSHYYECLGSLDKFTPLIEMARVEEGSSSRSCLRSRIFSYVSVRNSLSAHKCLVDREGPFKSNSFFLTLQCFTGFEKVMPHLDREEFECEHVHTQLKILRTKLRRTPDCPSFI